MQTKRATLSEATGGRCAYCGDALGDRWALDHVFPKALGGTRGDGNLVPACWGCNARKRAQTVETFRARVRERMIDAAVSVAESAMRYGDRAGAEAVVLAARELAEKIDALQVQFAFEELLEVAP